MVCFLHVHRRVLQSAMQLHLITRSRFSGAGARYVSSGTNPTLSDEVHQQIPSLLGLAGTHEDCGTLLFLVLVVGAGGWDLLTEPLMPRESRLSVESPLYSTTNAFASAHVTSCLEAECVCGTLACWRNELLAWNFLREVNPRSDSVEAMCRVTSKNCVQKEYVLALCLAQDVALSL